MTNENESTDDLTTLATRELREIAKSRGVKNVKNKTKEQLLAELSGAESTADLGADDIAKLEGEKAREIASLAKKLEKARDKLAATRREWNEKVASARQAFRDTVTSGDVADPDAHARLVAIKEAYQHQVEMEAGRAEHVGPCAEKVAKLDTALRKAVEDSDQLGLRF